jgi:hypothetical protein
VEPEGGRLMTYEMEYRGETFGDGAVRIVELKGVQENPDIRSSDVNRARSHGQWAGIDLLGGRAISATLQVVADPDTEADVYDRLRSTLQPTGVETPLRIRIPGFPDAQGQGLQASARVRRINIPVDVDRYQVGAPRVNVEWWATDPRFYEVDEQSTSVAVNGGQDSGMTFDAEFDLSFGGVTPRGAVTVTNRGNFAAPWRVAFDGPLVNVAIQNADTGERLDFDGTIPGGSQLVVDSLNRLVQLNGVSRYQWLGVRSQWFDLPSGPSRIRLLAENGTGSATFTFRSTWI